MTEIPVSIQEISPQWLSEALERSTGSPVTVTGFQVLDAHDGTTGRALLKPDYAEGGDALPGSLFLKLPPEDPSQRSFVTSVGMGKREAMVYQLLSSEFPIRVPKCYHSAWNNSGDRYIMVLENLLESGCTFRNASKNYSRNYVESVVSALARLHGTYLCSPRFQSDLAWVKPPPVHAVATDLVKRALDRHRNEQPPVFSQMAELFLNNPDQVHKVWRLGEQTLVHGDLHDGNLFSDRGEAGFLDWAITSRMSGMRDFANFVIGTVPPQGRQSLQPQLLEQYRREMTALGVKAPAHNELMQQYSWHAAYTWLASVTTLAMGSEWQPIRYVEKTLVRVHQAMDDLKTLDTIREAMR